METETAKELPKVQKTTIDKTYANLDEYTLDAFLKKILEENPWISKRLIYTKIELIGQEKYDESIVYQYSGILAYTLLKKESEKTRKKLPIITNETQKSFKEEYRKNKQYRTEIFEKISKENKEFLLIPQKIAEILIEKYWEKRQKKEICSILKSGREAVKFVYGIFQKQIESNNLEDTFGIF